jgi:hypothetical protein
MLRPQPGLATRAPLRKRLGVASTVTRQPRTGKRARLVVCAQQQGEGRPTPVGPATGVSSPLHVLFAAPQSPWRRLCCFTRGTASQPACAVWCIGVAAGRPWCGVVVCPPHASLLATPRAPACAPLARIRRRHLSRHPPTFDRTQHTTLHRPPAFGSTNYTTRHTTQHHQRRQQA